MTLYIRMNIVSKKQAAHKSQQFLSPIGLEAFVKSTLEPVSFNFSKLSARASAQLWLEINYITQQFQFIIGSHGNTKQ